MGLGLSLHFESKPRGLLRRRQGAREITSALAVALRDAFVLAFPELKQLVRLGGDDEGQAWLTLHPYAQNIFLVPEGKHGVHVDVRTATPGPGYHAFVLEQLERAAAALDLQLTPGTEDDPLDETGYGTSRDFAALQEEFARWLQHVCRIALEHSPASIALSMDQQTPRPVEYEILTGTGEFTFDWARRVSERGLNTIPPEVPEFFAWWEKGIGPRTLLGLARVLVHDFTWHPPKNEEERVRARLVFDLLGKVDPAARFGPDTVARLRTEIDALMNASPRDASPPREGGFGFRRRPVRHQVFDRGAVTVPGYWYTAQDDETNLEITHFGQRRLEIGSLIVSGGPVSEPFETVIANVCDTMFDAGGRTFEFEVTGGLGRGWIAKEPTDGKWPWIAKAVLGSDENVLSAVFMYSDPADEPLVEQILRSLNVNSHAR